MQPGPSRGASDETSRSEIGEPGSGAEATPTLGRRFVDEIVQSARRAQLAARRALASVDPDPVVDEPVAPLRMVPVVPGRRTADDPEPITPQPSPNADAQTTDPEATEPEAPEAEAPEPDQPEPDQPKPPEVVPLRPAANLEPASLRSLPVPVPRARAATAAANHLGSDFDFDLDRDDPDAPATRTPAARTPAARTPAARTTDPAPQPTGPRRAMAAPRRTWKRVLLDLAVHRRPKYSTVRGDIEGLRAIAVVWVLLYHLGVPGLSGGFAGVDVFFVISGFLITGQLLSMVKRTGRLDLADFWSRRLRRLMPAATLVLVTGMLLGWWLLPRSEWQRLTTDGQLAAVYVLNWGLAARSVDYLAEDAGQSVFQHYWSLGVEEQFYILWPLTIIVCLLIARRWTKRALVTITAGLALITVASALYSWFYTGVDAGRAYFSTLTRLWELAVGALVACFSVKVRRWFPGWTAVPVALVGLAAVVSSAFVIGRTDPWPGVWAWLPVAGAAAVLLAGNVRSDNLVARALGNPVMRQLGMLSYSLYLWHWPLIAIWTLRHPDAGWLSKVVIVLLTVVLSMLTLGLVEDPIRFSGVLQKHAGRAFVLAIVLLALTIGVAQAIRTQLPTVSQVDVLGDDPSGSASAVVPTPVETPSVTPTPEPTPLPVTGDYTGGLAWVFNSSVDGVPTLRTDLTAATRVTRTVVPDVSAASLDQPSVYASGCQRTKQQANPVRPDQCLIGSGPVRVALVGDSKMDQWEPALGLIGARHGWTVQTLAKSGCSFSSATQYETCNTYNQALLKQLLADPPDLVITSTYAERQGTVGPGMVDLLGQLQAKGSKLLFLEDNPTPTVGESPYQCAEREGSTTACEFANNEGHGTADLRYAARELGAPVLSMNEWICPPTLQKCPLVVGNVFVYRQSSHLTKTYVTSLTPILERELAAQGFLQPPVLPLQPSR
ncbi:acyltransferase family protein [Aestuariimicrobium soli]|uniref:acyltransferase family protein n=1 Tax=Aestuariimicrobium soli TaxID=2035834 RepID=UPI003EBD77B4